MIPSKWLVYMIAVSVAATFAMIGWTIRENHIHQQELAEAVELREAQVNQFLRTEVCERLEIRDEILIRFFRAGAARWAPKDMTFSDLFAVTAQAIEFSQRGCKAQLPQDG